MKAAGQLTVEAPGSVTRFDRAEGPALIGLVALGVLATIVAFVLTGRYGALVTPDSVDYLSAAESLRDGHGLRGVDGGAFIAFPPLFPTLLALLSVGPVEAVDAARALNAACFGITVGMTGWLVLRLSGSRTYAVLAAVAAALSRPLLQGALAVWSEPLFTALAMAALALAVRRTEVADERWSVASAVMAGAAALTRYVGVALAPLVAAAPLLGRPRDRRAIAMSLLAVALSLGPLALWLARNLAVSGTVAGERFPSSDPLPDNVYDAALALSRWALPVGLGDRTRLAVCAVAAAALAVAAGRANAVRLRAVALVGGFVLLYLGYLVAASSLTALDPIDERLVSPVVPPLIVLIFVGLSAALPPTRRAPGRWRLVIGVAALSAWLVLLSGESGQLVRRLDREGVGGYEAARWRDSATLAAVAQLPPDAVLVSNDPFAVRYWTGREARLSPRRHPYRAPGSRVDDLSDLREALAGGAPAFLVSFEGVPRDFLFSLGDLDSILSLEPVVRVDGGAVYRITGTK